MSSPSLRARKESDASQDIASKARRQILWAQNRHHHRHRSSEERVQVVKNYSSNKVTPKSRAKKPEMEVEPTTPAGMRRDMAKDKAMMKDMKAPWPKGSKY